MSGRHVKSDVSLRLAVAEDIGYIMSVERQPGYAEWIGTLAEAEHARRMTAPGSRYVMGLYGGAPVGFAVLRQEADGMGVVNLHRFAVATPGCGLGTALLGAVCDLVFAAPEVGRLWLDVLPHNAIAHHVYGRQGFVVEGILRHALRQPDGRREDLVLMSLLRQDWRRFAA